MMAGFGLSSISSSRGRYGSSVLLLSFLISISLFWMLFLSPHLSSPSFSFSRPPPSVYLFVAAEIGFDFNPAEPQLKSGYKEPKEMAEDQREENTNVFKLVKKEGDYHQGSSVEPLERAKYLGTLKDYNVTKDQIEKYVQGSVRTKDGKSVDDFLSKDYKGRVVSVPSRSNEERDEMRKIYKEVNKEKSKKSE